MLKKYILLILLVGSHIVIAQDTKKVLIIGIDGCRPDVLQLASTPNIDLLLSNSTYSYHALNDDITYSGPGWSAMMTGVWSGKHGVTDNGFAGNNFNDFPHFIKRVEENLPSLYTVSISQWHPINNSIALDYADFKYNATSETEVTLQAVNQLDNFDPDVIFLHYDDVDHAGHAYGFDLNVPEYISSIESVDTEIGQVLQSLYARPEYLNENWLILLSTDHGGQGSSHGGSSPQEETIFFIANNKNFEERIITPDTVEIIDITNCVGNSKHLYLDSDTDMVNVPHFSELNFGENEDFTIECRIKTSTAADVAILSNKNWDSGSNDGFVFSFKFADGPEWKVNIGDGSNRLDINTGGTIADNEWHHLAVTFDRDGEMIMYENGVLVDSANMSSIGNIDNGAPLRFGADINGAYNYSGAIEEVRIWNGVLSNTDINNWKCNSIDNTHPRYSDLIGYWPLNEGAGNIANDLSPNTNHGNISLPEWSALDSTISYDQTPRITDISITAMDWLCLDIDNNWNLDGKSWIDSFPTVRVINDDTPGSLRSVINTSCPEDSIFFHYSLTGNDHLLSREIVIPHSLAIIGLGETSTSISGNYQHRIFDIPSGVNFLLDKLKLHESNELTNGGAIFNRGNLVLKNILFENNFQNNIPKAITNLGNIRIENNVLIKNP